jgi:hypothetical protein
MTEIKDSPVPGRDDVRLLLEDLACVSGALSEIMTAWRRARASRPELSLSALTQLQDTARQLAADIRASAGLGQVLNPALSIAERISALNEDAARTREAAGGPDRSAVGDRGLWELLGAAMSRAGTRLVGRLAGRVAAFAP